MSQNQQELPDLGQVAPSTRIGVIGGTGPQGRGLALRWAHAGMRVRIGSRDPKSAMQAAAAIRETVLESGSGTSGTTGIRGIDIGGDSNEAVAAWAEIVAIVVPWAGHRSTLEALRDALRGKLVIDCVNPLGFDKQGAYALPVAEGSATQQAAALLPESRVVGAFHNVSAVLLNELSGEVACDVLVLGEDRADAGIVQQLADLIPGARGVYGGQLRDSAQVEALTANLISINRRYKVHSGVRIAGIACR